MSKMSKIFEYLFKRNRKEYMDDKDVAKKYLEERSIDEDEAYTIPKRVYRTKVESKYMFDC
jgi:hypothetical protein